MLQSMGLQRVWHDCDWTHQRPQLLLDSPLYSVSSHWVPVCAPTPSLFSPELNFPLLLVLGCFISPSLLLLTITFCKESLSLALFNCPFPMSHLFPARFLTDAGWFVPFVWMLSCSRWFQRDLSDSDGARMVLYPKDWFCWVYKGFTGGNNWDFFFFFFPPLCLQEKAYAFLYTQRRGNWTEYSLGHYISFLLLL